jgi:hypothetical protein
MAQEGAESLKDRSVLDMQTHFLRNDARNTNFLDMQGGCEIRLKPDGYSEAKPDIIPK